MLTEEALQHMQHTHNDVLIGAYFPTTHHSPDAQVPTRNAIAAFTTAQVLKCLLGGQSGLRRRGLGMGIGNESAIAEWGTIIMRSTTVTTMSIQSRDDLIAHIEVGNWVEYLFFWGHQRPTDGSITKACLSQWYDAAPFTIGGITYATAEHWMMASKARLFGDADAEQHILRASTPKAAKQFGRGVRNFDARTWEQHRSRIVIEGNVAKFSQHPDLKQLLLNTGDKVLVEASPYDAIWGIKLAEGHPDAKNPHKWQGLNLLGFALMQVREQLTR